MDRKIKPENIIRVCEYLNLQGEEIVKYSSWVLWGRGSINYFMSLKEYCSFYNEMKVFLNEKKSGNKILSDKINELPKIEFKNYSSDYEDWKSYLILFLRSVFFPVAYIWMWSGMKYIENTKEKIYSANRTFSSIAFLIKAQNAMELE